MGSMLKQLGFLPSSVAMKASCSNMLRVGKYNQCFRSPLVQETDILLRHSDRPFLYRAVPTTRREVRVSLNVEHELFDACCPRCLIQVARVQKLKQPFTLIAGFVTMVATVDALCEAGAGSQMIV
ncbi:hypothetical protein ColLi_05510 [Colletotrichum liriopes]|uniref:Uncharacterized protein n=1 Tax=Colletotrichum liriopes TaxID=708192 RepID=A0AA37GKZ5_9PEZI|nr:hypothetical protein ColLi_05510 [Colletotrichum liriopes]